MDEIIKCKGCKGNFLAWDISEDGYCECCDYQHQANLDSLTDGDHE